MSVRLMVASAIAFLLLAATPARAQDGVGLVAGVPASIGVLWHATSSVAFRPEFAVSRTSSEVTTSVVTLLPGGGVQTVSSTSRTWTAGVGASALWYVRTIDRVRVYVSPRLIYSWGSNRTEPAVPASAGPSVVTTDSRGFTGSGSIGAQYTPHDRFGVFGEVGISYLRQTSDTGGIVGPSESTLTSVGVRSGVGIVLYF